MPQPVALITGTSSGIGEATARRLTSRGFHVFGTSRNPTADSGSAYGVLPLDVRSDASVHAAVRSVLDQTGRIDVLVNNAGYGQTGAVEEVGADQAHAQFDTNVFGGLRLIEAVVPEMRRKGSGRIINVSSVLGQVAPPFMGVYAASKFALEGLSEALRAELRPFGIYVSLVEPGFVKSNFVAQGPLHPLAEYDTARKSAAAFARRGVESGLDPLTVAEVILRIATTTQPGLRYPVGRASLLLIALKGWLPEALFDRVRRRVFAIDARAVA